MARKNVLKIFCAGIVLFSAAFAAWNGFGASSEASADSGDSAQNAFVRVRGHGVRRVNGRDFVATGGVVRVEANPGWQLLSPSVLKLGGDEPVSYRVRDYSGENTPGGNIDEERTVTTETHVSAPRIAAQIDCRGPWVYAMPQTQVDFANAVFEGALVTNGVHRRRTRTYRNGILESEEVRYVGTEPDRWTWAWRLGPTQGSQWGQTFSSHLSSVTAGVYVVTGAVTAVNTACEKCQASATAKKNLIVSELSVTCGAYIGQDRTGDPTQPYRSPSVKAVAHLTPANPSITSVDWTYRGGCEQSRNSGMSLELWTTNREYASSRYLGELVRAKYKTVSVSTNFTVVKVDVAVKGVEEFVEERMGAFIPFVGEESANGEEKSLVPINFTCVPKNLPSDEMIEIVAPQNYLYLKNGGKYDLMPRVKRIQASSLNELNFYLHGRAHSDAWGDENVEVLHSSSKGRDRLLLTCGTLKFVMPSGDPKTDPKDGGAGQNEFTYSDQQSAVTVNLSVSVTPSFGTDSEDGFFPAGRFSVSDVADTYKVWKGGGDGLVEMNYDIWSEIRAFSTSVSYTNYPLHNAAFGRKTATFEFAGLCITNDFEIFFPKNGTNHPPCQTCGNCPNWFYYWREGNVCSIPNDAIYIKKDTTYGAWDKINKRIELSDLAAQCDTKEHELSATFNITHFKFSVISNRASFFSDVNTNSARLKGLMYFATNIITDISEHHERFRLGGGGKGIGCVAMTIKHELGHRDLDVLVDKNQKIIEQRSNVLDEMIETFGYDSLEAATAKRDLSEAEWNLGD